MSRASGVAGRNRKSGGELLGPYSQSDVFLHTHSTRSCMYDDGNKIARGIFHSRELESIA